MGFNLLPPIRQKASHLTDSLISQVGPNIVSPACQGLCRITPGQEQRINPQRGPKPFVAPESLLPNRPLQIVEWRVCHANRADTRQFQATRDVILGFPLCEPLAQRRQIPLAYVESKSVQSGDYSAACFRNRRVLDE